MLCQGGGTPTYSVLLSASMPVKKFDRKKLSWHCIDFTIVGFIAEILLDLDQLHRIYQRVIVV